MRLILIGLPTTLFLCACSSVPEYPYPDKRTIFLEADGETLTKQLAIQRQKSLEANLAKWKLNQPDHFTYIIAQSCYCMYGPSYGPNEIKVSGGNVAKVTYRGEKRDGFRSGDILTNKRSLNYSIDDLFNRVSDVLQEAITGNIGPRRKGTPRFLIEYHPDYSFPTKIAFDDPTRADEEWVIVVENIKVIKDR